MLNSLIWNASKGPITYPKWPIIPLAPLLAYVALAVIERFSHKIALVTPAFYVAWLVSCVIVVSITYVVYWITVRFDAHYPWHAAVKKRIKKQFFAGLVLPAILAFILASFYFLCFSINIFETNWFRRYFPAVLTLLVIINTFFGFYGSFKEGKLKIAKAEKELAVALLLPAPVTLVELIEVAPQELAAPLFIVQPEAQNAIAAPHFIDALEPTLSNEKEDANLQSKPLIDAELLDIACVFCCNKHYYAIDFAGKIDGWNHNITDSEPLFPPSYFCLVDRSFIVNFAAIKDVKHPGPKSTRIILLPQVAEGIVKTYLKFVGEQTLAPTEEGTQGSNNAEAKKILDPKAFLLSVSYEQKKSFITARDKFSADLKVQLAALKSKA